MEEKAQNLPRSVREALPTGRKVLSKRGVGKEMGSLPLPWRQEGREEKSGIPKG